jgi:predicted alpha/beta hydrolase family esterase
MRKNIIFFQGGGGEEDYAADGKLVDSLQSTIGDDYTIHYPRLPDEPVPDFGRIDQIDKAISNSAGDTILAGHSLGASMLLKYLSENELKKKISGVFLLSTPFWSGDEDWKEPLKLKKNFANTVSKDIPIFMYHCTDDEVVPFAHLALYKQHLPWATFREIHSGGHQVNNDLAIVAQDIKSL